LSCHISDEGAHFDLITTVTRSLLIRLTIKSGAVCCKFFQIGNVLNLKHKAVELYIGALRSRLFVTPIFA